MPAIRTHELTFIVGADIARTLPAWREPSELLELAELAVAARAGTGASAVLEPTPLLAAAGGERGADRSGSSTCAAIEVSSSMVRERVARASRSTSWSESAVARLHRRARAVRRARSGAEPMAS